MSQSVMKVAVVGGGVSGLTAAYVLANEGGTEVVLYEREDHFGAQPPNFGFLLYNPVTYPDMVEFMNSLGVDMDPSDMSFSVSLSESRQWEWGTSNGLLSLFAQKANIINPSFWKFIQELNKFKIDSINYLDKLEHNPGIDQNATMKQFLTSYQYSKSFQKAFLVPFCASIWSGGSSDVMNLSAYTVLSFFRNHHTLQQLYGRSQGLNLKQHSEDYITRIKHQLELRGCQIKTNSEVHLVSTNENRCSVISKDGSDEAYDRCIIALNAQDALKLLGKEVTYDELRILGAFQYANSDVYLHHDNSLMPKNRSAWSSWNFKETSDGNGYYITYWLDPVKNYMGETGLPYLLSVNPPCVPEHMLCKWSTSHPIPSVAAWKALSELNLIQGKRRLWFCGAYQGYGFNEDGLRAGMHVANNLLGKGFRVQKNNPKHMVPSWLEAAARLVVTTFFGHFIATGCLILVEDGGASFTFEGARKLNVPKVYLRVHSPRFYWKAATESDIGFADAYINGEISFVDKKEGLLNLITIFSANIELSTCASNVGKKRGWWTPLLFTSVIASAKYFFNNISKRNSIPQARLNIASHYDLSNELFSLFMDETMTYSCAVFKTPSEEDLKTAQLRKLHGLINKARIDSEHHILELGCGWGSLAIEAVKRTGCKYTGITLSKEQVKYAEEAVEKAGLQDRIKFILCDYRELPQGCKYDRIISCELMEAVGHEYMEEFFKCCDVALAPNGIFVLQTSAIADNKYDEYRLSHGFIKEYIFPGGYVPSLSRITSAMAAASSFRVVDVQDNGSSYYYTLRHWRKRFLENQSKIMALGFDDKFIRTWEYYFDYCASGFKGRVLGNYQIVFTRPGDASLLGNDPHEPMISFY
ncbi:uncharacterized protein LOC127247592 [Andrographis paniculata]|uniref:uncharacterized protein LOC127247592 n=1 Tax=Andrographis paniculata TaxID=175694 RepID=UPI0021E712C2|nr:uncharacterized protein LOC127247592 [Andrographis paniculata]